MFYEVIPTEVYRKSGGALTYSSDLTLKPGHLVLIPLGRKTVLGLILKRVRTVDFPTKKILRLVLPTPIPKLLLDAAFWLSSYYLAPLPTCFNLLFPASLLSKNALSMDSDPARDGNSSSFSEIKLNNAQKHALEALYEAPGPTRLLRGVTGSGKTNIYLKLAENALKAQKSTILLVPEIALTSQLIRIFTKTFGDRVMLIHSAQTLVKRRSTWLKILSSKVPVVIIGPRSALFAPVHNLGLILIDEAHESAYFQENTPHYSAVRLASFMAKKGNFPCILGTATPNLVDYYLAKSKHSLVELDQKAKSTAIDPKISLIDLKDRANFTRNRYFSNILLTKIEKNLQDKHQTLIFHNRRGSSPLTLCEHCGWQALCPECYLPLSLHTDTYTLRCHICGHEAKVPSSCPSCKHTGIIHKGFGTKLLESELTRFFPSARIARFDGDNKKDTALSHLYKDVHDGKIDILIGTQTLARGLDLPNLATVGIIQADSGLSLPDFAAEERTFELLTQVIGRVGRGHLDIADVVVQTYQPDHPVVQTALKSDYLKFADYLLKSRKKSALPPFSYLATFSITYKTEKTTLTKIRSAYSLFLNNPRLSVSPPMPAFHERTSRGYTWQLTLKSSSRTELLAALKPFANEKCSITIDPPSLL